MDLIEFPIAFGAAAAGALVGSWSAFRWNIFQQKRDEKEREHGALLRAQYALLSQRDTVEEVRKDYLEPHRQDVKGRYLKISMDYVPGSHFPVPLAEISFIADSDDPKLLLEVHKAQREFEATIEIMRMRNQRAERLSSSPYVNIKDFNFETGNATLNPDVVGEVELFFLRAFTDRLYMSIDQAIPRLLKASEAVEAYIKQNFPGKKARLAPARDFPQ